MPAAPLAIPADKQQARRRCLQHRGLVDPRTSQWLHIWDSVIGVALIFTAIYLPYEVAFFLQDLDDGGAAYVNFVLNRVLDLLFLFDTVLRTHPSERMRVHASPDARVTTAR
jgi:hypothetical protein